MRRNVAVVGLVMLLAAVMCTTACQRLKKAPGTQVEFEDEAARKAAEAAEPVESARADDVTRTPLDAPPQPAARDWPLSDEELGWKTIYFAFDSAALTAESRSSIEHNAGILKDNESVRVLIEGHCDERGTIEYNLALGERRALAARNYLINLGIDPDRIATISYGEERPVDQGHDEEAWSKNRRDEFRASY